MAIAGDITDISFLILINRLQFYENLITEPVGPTPSGQVLIIELKHETDITLFFNYLGLLLRYIWHLISNSRIVFTYTFVFKRKAGLTSEVYFQCSPSSYSSSLSLLW